jgi:hypothetical protein
VYTVFALYSPSLCPFLTSPYLPLVPTPAGRTCSALPSCSLIL